MWCTRPVCRIASVLPIVIPLTAARADPALVLDEPVTADKQPPEYNLQVQEDGLAILHFKWVAPDREIARRTVDLSLARFTGDGQSAAVGFDPGPQGGLPLRYVRGLTVPASGAEIRIFAADLAPGVDYLGSLSAIIGKDRVIWKIALSRPGALPAVRCPTGPLTVNPDGSIAVELTVLRALRIAAVDLHLSQFVSRDNELGQIGFAPDAGGELRRDLAGVALDGSSLRLPLRASGLTETAMYTGTLRVVAGARDAVDCSLTVVMPRLPRAELVADRQTVVRTITKPWSPFGNDREDASVTVRLFEKTRSQSVYGIAVLQDGATTSPGDSLDLGEQASFLIDDCPVASFLRLRPWEFRASGRMLPAGGQMSVRMDLRALRPGTYTFGLRFTGVNAASPSPKLDVTLHVRHHWSWAVVAIAFALVVSGLATRAIAAWRERLRLRARIRQLRSASFAEHADLSLVVLLRALLAQTEAMLAHRRYLPPPDSARDHLVQAERVATILSAYRAAMAALDATACLSRVKDPYRKAIADAIQDIPDPLVESKTNEIVAQLNEIKTRLSAPFGWYWSTRKADAALVARQVRETAEFANRDIAALVDRLEKPPVVADDPSAMFDERVAEFDRSYWFLRLVHSRRRYRDDVRQLLDWYRGHQAFDVVHLFDKADALAWARLEKELQDGRVAIEPVVIAEAQEALRPMTFRLRFADQEFASSYFMNNVLFYDWQFLPTRKLTRRQWLRERLTLMFRRGAPRRASGGGHGRDSDPGKRPGRAATITVRQPQVAYYANYPGEVTPRVSLRWESLDGVRFAWITGEPCAVVKNEEVKLARRQSLPLALHVVLIAAIALITALPTLYFSNPSFGSFGDYVAILAWAVGIDQGKNLLQLLKEIPADKPVGATGS